MADGLVCRHCGSSFFKRNGLSRGTRRYLCRACGRTFTDTPPRFSAATRARALDMHLNNVGVRKTARFIGCAPASVINWVRAAHDALRAERAERAERTAASREAAGDAAAEGAGDVIEMDEIYTFVQKSVPWSGAPTRAADAASSPSTSAKASRRPSAFTAR